MTAARIWNTRPWNGSTIVGKSLIKRTLRTGVNSMCNTVGSPLGIPTITTLTQLYQEVPMIDKLLEEYLRTEIFARNHPFQDPVSREYYIGRADGVLVGLRAAGYEDLSDIHEFLSQYPKDGSTHRADIWAAWEAFLGGFYDR
jgi:hypothetical protein